MTHSLQELGLGNISTLCFLRFYNKLALVFPFTLSPFTHMNLLSAILHK